MARTILILSFLCFKLSMEMPIAGVIGEEGSLTEGDILQFPDDNKRALNEEGTLWPNNTVYYVFDNLTYSERAIFIEAMDRIEAKTCIEFEHADRDTVAYLNLTMRHKKCCSYVGMTGVVQDVSLGPGCTKVGNAIHELGHALGLYHEHTRPDRDNYITVNFQNIQEGLDVNFHINPRYQQNLVDMVNYDLGSVMHYKSQYFSANDMDTIEINPDIYIPDCLSFGQRKRLSFGDAMKINVLYQCTDDIQSLVDDCPVVPPTTPTPTETPSPTTPPPCDRKFFLSGDKVYLNFGRTADEVIQCSPDQRLGCSKSACTGYSGCKDTEYRMYLAEDRGNKVVKSGDEVVLEMVDSRSSRHAMACNRNGSCLLETCPNNPPTISPITSPSSEFCDSQKMKIYGYKKNGGLAGRILDYHTVVFRAVDNNEKFLNCFGKACKFYTHSTCDEDDDLSFSGQSSTTCEPQHFQLRHSCSYD